MAKSVVESIGELHHKLRIEKPVTVENDNGVPVTTWAHVCTVWAAIRDMSGREFFEAAAHQMENVTTFTIRWRNEIDTSMRVVFGGKPYEIVQVNRLGYQRDYMQIKARRIGGEGA